MFREPFPILYVDDVERSRRFDGDVLGFTSDPDLGRADRRLVRSVHDGCA
jgi:hypothetical protein